MASRCSGAPIAWDGVVYIGNAGGDFKGGKGHMYALEGKTGKILWEFYLTPKTESDAPRGPVGTSPLQGSTWNNAPGIPVTGAGTWTSYTLDLKNGLLYVPGGNPGPDFASGAREGNNQYTDSVVVIDAKTGNYKNHFQVVPKDWHDYDVSNPPILLQTKGGRQIMSVAPKDGHLYAYDLADNSLLYRVPITTIENDAATFAVGTDVHFCPGPVGGDEWNTPGYDPTTNLIISGTVDWCDTVTIKDDTQLRRVALGQPWTGMATLNPINMFGKESRTDGYWAGWVYATDADTGVWKWRVKSNYPIVAGITPTAGGVVFFADVGGNFYALDSVQRPETVWRGARRRRRDWGRHHYLYRERRTESCRGCWIYDGRVANEARDRQGHSTGPRQRLAKPVTFASIAANKTGLKGDSQRSHFKRRQAIAVNQGDTPCRIPSTPLSSPGSSSSPRPEALVQRRGGRRTSRSTPSTARSRIS